MAKKTKLFIAIFIFSLLVARLAFARSSPSLLARSIFKDFKEGTQIAKGEISESVKGFFKWLGEKVKGISKIFTKPTEEESIAEKDIEELKKEIEELKSRPEKEVIKEKEIVIEKPVIQQIKEVIKEIDEEIKKKVSEILSWKEEISQKISLYPPEVSAPTAPIYVSTQGLQVGGHGNFSSLGVSGIAGIKYLGVGGSASIGSIASDEFIVSATTEFNALVTAKAGLTVGTGTLDIDSRGNLTTTGTITAAGAITAQSDLTVQGNLIVSGAQTYSGSAVFEGNIRLGQAPTTFTTLSADMDDTQTTASVVSTAGYPSSGTLFIDSGFLEIMTYTGKTATSFTGLTRGALGTTANWHYSGDTVRNYLFTASATTSTVPKVVITGDGKVGIGTIEPASKLAIVGSINIADGAGMSLDAMRSLIIGDFGESSAAGGTFGGYDYGWLAVEPHRIYVLNGIRTDGDIIVETGKVGIGDDTPTYSLDVNGTLRSTATTTLATAGGYVGIGTTVPESILDVSGKLTVRGEWGGRSWKLNYNGSKDYILSLAVYNGKLYAGQGGPSAGDGDVLVFDGSTWSTSYNGTQKIIYSLAVYNGKLYAGQGGSSAGDGDILVFDGSTWSTSSNGTEEAIYSLAVYNGKLYAGQGYDSGDGDILVFDGSFWSTSYNGTEEYILSLVVYNGKLYAGQGYGSGADDVLVFDGSIWSTFYNDGTEDYVLSLAVYNGKLYAGQGGTIGGGDVLVFDGSSWSTSYNGTEEYIYSPVVYNGKLYAGQSGLNTGDGDVLVFDGSSWSTSFNGTEGGIYSLAVYNGKLYAGQGYESGDGDIYVFEENLGWQLAELQAKTDYLSWSQADRDRYALTIAGNLGIGTTAPRYTFDVSGTGRFFTTSDSALTITQVGTGKIAEFKTHLPGVSNLMIDTSSNELSTILIPKSSLQFQFKSSISWTATSSWNAPSGGLNSCPAFADLDNDGDYDLLIGKYDGASYGYENTGSATNPIWTAKSSWNAPNVGYYGAPAFADLDNDGDYDLLIGANDGISHAYENTGSATNPIWTAKSSWNAPDVGTNVHPAFADLDNDGDYDLLIGTSPKGHAYENTGSATNPIWTNKDSWDTPSLGDQVLPAFADLDNDGDYDLLLGHYDGTSYGYENTGSATNPIWTAKSSWNAPNVGGMARPAFADLDNDGDYDLLIGVYASGASYAYENTGSNTSIFFGNFGKVGIGTTTPAVTLDINGDFRVSATSTLGSATSTPVIFTGYIQSNFVPYEDDTYSLGASNFRWANLYAGTTTIGDIVFANQFRITESIDSPQTLILLNQNGEEIARLDEYGNFALKGQINSLSVAQNNQGQIVNLNSEQVRSGLTSLGLIVNEQGVLEVETLKAKKVITEKFEIRDKITGEIYCTWIENGEWKKVKGECENEQSIIEQTLVESPSSETTSTATTSTEPVSQMSNENSTSTTSIEDMGLITNTSEEINQPEEFIQEEEQQTSPEEQPVEIPEDNTLPEEIVPEFDKIDTTTEE